VGSLTCTIRAPRRGRSWRDALRPTRRPGAAIRPAERRSRPAPGHLDRSDAAIGLLIGDVDMRRVTRAPRNARVDHTAGIHAQFIAGVWGGRRRGQRTTVPA